MITRPDQGNAPLTMNVVRGQALEKTHVIPGETIKGVLRNCAYAVCVDAGRMQGNLRVGLKEFYRQTLGGITFSSETREVGRDEAIRAKEPLLSLFGAASPLITGRIIVNHALAQPTMNSTHLDGTGLPQGTRRDGLTIRPEWANLLSPDDQSLWARQHIMVTSLSDATRRLEDAKRTVARAARNKGVDLGPLEAALAAAQAQVTDLKSAPEFQQTIQRPLPIKNAAPVGTIYDHEIQVVDATPSEIGLLMASLELWSQQPRIGGGKTVGYGWIECAYVMEVLSDNIRRRDRVWLPGGTILLGGRGPTITTSYDKILDSMASWRRVEEAIRTETKIFD
jgi:hypothetical protein